MGIRVFHEKQRFTQWWLWLIIIISFGLVLYKPIKLYLTAPNFSVNDLGEGLWIAIIVMVLVHFFLALCRLNTEIDEQGIRYQFFPFHRVPKRISWNDLESIYVRTYRPISEYGGWGYRIGLSGRAYNVKGNQGIQLTLKTGKKLLIGTQKPEEAQQIINTYFKDERI